MTTLTDVAKIAEVSTMTVSNVLAGKQGKVSARTAERVWAAVQSTGYVPNSAARSLSANRSRLIAIVLSGDGEALQSLHDARFVGAMTVNLQEHGYVAMVHAATNLKQTTASLRSWSVDGVCFLKTYATEIDKLRDEYDVPMLFPDNYSDTPGILTVRVDDFGGGRMAAERLLAGGHRHACFVGPRTGHPGVVEQRLDGFRSAFAAADLPRPGALPDVADVSIASGEAAAARVLQTEPRPTAIFCSADELAAGLIRGLQDAGCRVPEDVSVIGFDGFDIGEVTSPPLTTIAQDVGLKAQRSAELLLEALTEDGASTSGTTTGNTRSPLPVHLVERASVRNLTE